MMKKYLLLLALGSTLPVMAQSAMDAYQLSQSDMKGTARFMSMGGAFGALGGDLSTLSQNPAGIGVYRGNDFGFTLDLDAQSASTKALGADITHDQTKFYLNNIGIVTTWRLNDSGLKNINFGFTYQKAASFNRQYRGVIPSINTSLSNYIAGISNGNNLSVGDVTTTNNYDPYNPNDGGYVSPWISILGYDSYLTTPTGSDNQPNWIGQFGEGTTGNAWLNTLESGAVDEYNLAIGGNIENVFFWGMDFGFTDINYTQQSYWGESLTNAYLPNPQDNNLQLTTADWSLYNYYNMKGSGFNYKLGIIIKPIQELRLGFAFHTPTWYNLTQTYYGDVDYTYGSPVDYTNKGEAITTGLAQTNNGYDAYNDLKFRTPWRIIASAAGVIGSNLIVSADYEWKGYSGMNFSTAYNGWGYDPMLGQNMDEYYYTNQDIKDYYTGSNTIRLGAEYRLTPQFSVRAGYSYSSTAAKDEFKDGTIDIWTAGTRPQYVVDNSTEYITCGLGYRYKKFYIDGAFVYKHYSSDFHAFPQDPASPSIISPTATVDNNNCQVVLSMGFKF